LYPPPARASNRPQPFPDRRAPCDNASPEMPAHNAGLKAGPAITDQ